MPSSGGERTGEHIDQRGLAAAVRPDDADAVAALDAGREIADDRTAIKALADVFSLDDQCARRRRLARDDLGIAGGGAIIAPTLAQPLQQPDAAHIAFAPRGDAVAHPMLFGDDLAVELVLIALLFGEHRITPLFEMRKAALDAPGQPAIEPDHAARQRRQETAVVADDDQRRAPSVEIALEPLDRGQVEMIGRLVEQEHIGLGREHAGERGAARLAAGQRFRILATGEPELLEQIAHRVRIGAFIPNLPQAGFGIGECRGEAVEIRLLRQIADQRAGLHEHGAAIGLDQACCDLEQGRFARAVAPDQRHPLARRNAEFRRSQKRRAAEGECDVFELKKRRSH